jgi:hypothetical protein
MAHMNQEQSHKNSIFWANKIIIIVINLFQLLMNPLYNYLRINNYNTLLILSLMKSYIYLGCLFHIYRLIYLYLTYDMILDKPIHIPLPIYLVKYYL